MRFSIRSCLLVAVLLFAGTTATAQEPKENTTQTDEANDLDSKSTEQASEELQTPLETADDESAQDQKQELSDMELIERVAFLQREIEAAEIPKRDAAEKELMELGVRVLDYLEPTTDKTPTDAVTRTNKIRKHLETIAVASVTKAANVTLKGTMTIEEALKSLRSQSKNDVDVPEETPDVFLDLEIEMSSENVGFWPALTEIMEKGSLVVDPYAGGRGQLKLAPTREANFKAANPGVPVPVDLKHQPSNAPRCSSGIFDVSVTQVSASRNLANPAQDYCNIHMLVQWEPRVMPITIDMPAAKIKALDEFDQKIEIKNDDAVFSGLVQPEVSNLEFSIPIALVDRQIEVIKSLELTIDAVLPGRTEKFRFRKLGKLNDGASQTKAGATVTFGGINKNEDLFGVSVGLSFDEESNALESHQSWVYNNQIYLEDEAGERHEALAYEGVTQTNNMVEIRYYFEKDPKTMTLHYLSPAAIVQVPIKILLKNIPLP